MEKLICIVRTQHTFDRFMEANNAIKVKMQIAVAAESAFTEEIEAALFKNGSDPNG
jgi:hypothetical protein